MRPLRVFLCHASQDKPAVRELYSALKSEGWIDPWLDKAKILPGQDWEMVIEKAVDDSDVVIACLSSQSVTKEGFAQREIRYAYDIALEKPEDTIFLIPLRLDDCKVPRKLRTLHWVDYFGAEKRDAYSDLLEALKLRYEQKLGSEAEEIARKQVEKQLQHEADELAHKVAAEKAVHNKAVLESQEKAKREAKEKTAREQKSASVGRVTTPRSKSNSTYANFRMFGIGGIILFTLICGGFGLNYLINNMFSGGTPTNTPLTNTLSTGTPPINPVVGSTWPQTIDGMTLVYVPAGIFPMGSDSNPDEQPIHQVDLNAFWIDQTEVTNAMYAKCVAANKCDPPSNTNHYSNSSYRNHPVVYVDWNKANAYCSWAERRLPTEAEWEKAARGIAGRTYPWGNESPNSGFLLNYNNNVGDTTEVGKYPNGASIYGALDMAGNVWEWVSSLYQPYPYESSDGRENMSSSGTRVLHGSSWISADSFVRSASRYWSDPTSSGYSFGFRCARSP